MHGQILLLILKTFSLVSVIMASSQNVLPRSYFPIISDRYVRHFRSVKVYFNT